MTIAEMRERGKQYLGHIPKDVLIVLILLFSSTAAFGLGILAGEGLGQSGGFRIEEIPLESATGTANALSAVDGAGEGVTPAPSAIPAGGELVGAKTGTKYYLPWCSGVSRIADANKVWFANAADAQAKGYSPASNCKGL